MKLGIMVQNYGIDQDYDYKKNRCKSGTDKAAMPYSGTSGQGDISNQIARPDQLSAVELFHRMRRANHQELPEAEAAQDTMKQQNSPKLSKSKADAPTAFSRSSDDEPVSIKEKSASLEEPGEEETSKSDTQIIVKPDGSRVLIMKISTGGMEASMSLEISGPTDRINDCEEETEMKLETETDK